MMNLQKFEMSKTTRCTRANRGHRRDGETAQEGAGGPSQTHCSLRRQPGAPSMYWAFSERRHRT